MIEHDRRGGAIRARGVLLDMDGTLVDSTAVVERLWAEWATAHGLDPAGVLAVIHGRQSHESMRDLLPGRPDEENLAESRALLARETVTLEGVREIAGAGAFVAALEGVPHALVTSATVPLATARMDAAGVRMPPVAIAAERVSRSKPDPEGFLVAADALGLAPEDCLVFEDSGAGIDAARRAGMRVVGVGSGAAARGADWTVADLRGVRVDAAGHGVAITLPR